MLVRKLRNTDIPVLREIHRKAGYSFPFPRSDQLEIGFVAEDGGYPIGMVGAELRAEVIGIFDPDWGSPHERMKLFASLHLPTAEQLNVREVGKGYCFIDPRYPRFGERLRELGWSETWPCYQMSVRECITALRRKAK